MTRLFSFLTILGLASGFGTPIAHAQFRDIVQHLPRESNVLVLFNVDSMMWIPNFLSGVVGYPTSFVNRKVR